MRKKKQTKTTKSKQYSQVLLTVYRRVWQKIFDIRKSTNDRYK